MTPEEKSKTRLQVLTAGLKQNHGMLLDAGALPRDGKEPNWDMLARGLQENPKKWNGKPLSEHPQAFQDLMNTQLTRVDAIAKHISDAEEEQEKKASIGKASWGQIGRAFLNDPLGFIGAIFQGIMNMINGGSFSDAFKPLIAPIVAKDVGQSTFNRLALDPAVVGHAIQKDGKGQPILTPAEKAELTVIANTVHNEALKQGGVADATKFLPVASAAGNDGYVAAAYANVLRGFGLTQGFDINPAATAAEKNTLSQLQIATGKFDVATPEGKAHMKVLVNTIAGTMNAAAKSNPPLEPQKVRDLVRGELDKQSAAMGLGDIAGKNETLLIISNQISVQYLESRAVDMASESTKAFVAGLKAETAELSKTIVAVKVNAQWEDMLAKLPEDERKALNSALSADKQAAIRGDIISAITELSSGPQPPTPVAYRAAILGKMEEKLKNSIPDSGGNLSVDLGIGYRVDNFVKGEITPENARKTIAMLVADGMTNIKTPPEKIKETLNPTVTTTTLGEIGLLANPLTGPMAVVRFIGRQF